MLYWIIIIGICILTIYIMSKLKIPKIGAVTLITGGVKCGKTTMSVRIAYKAWKQNCFKVKVYNYIVRWFIKGHHKKEMPLLYSNIPLSIPYSQLTEDLIYRRKRFVYGSVIYLCEASLIADSMSFKDQDLNECLTLFVKLIGHELKSGNACLVIDTQSVEDLHYGFKRNLSTFYYIHHKINLPFFLILKVREMIYLDGSTNEFNEDVEETLKTVIVPKKTWKLFDAYCYSAFTDHLPVERQVLQTEDLKSRKILTFKKNKKYYEVTNDEQKV